MATFGKRVRGEGPTNPGGFMGIGEWPGKSESFSGRPFSGKTGRELDRFLDGIRLPSRGDWFLTNWIREWCGPDGDYVQADFDRDEPELVAEIRRVQPILILAMGRHVIRWFMGDVDVEEVHGIPWFLPLDSPRRVLFDDPSSVVVVPQYNVAAGFRSPEISAAIAYDFAQLEAIFNGEITTRILYDDPIPNPEYREITDTEELDEVMIHATTIATDTEGWPWRPWSAQITIRPGESYVLRVKKLAGLGLLGPVVERFVEWVNTCTSNYRFIFHNALHDLAVFRALGVDTTRLIFDDTMIMSFNLQLEPQGLKPLCARFCGMRMEHYDEVMGDASFRLAQDWLMSALENEDFAYETRCQEEFVRLRTTPYITKSGKHREGRNLKRLPKLPKTDLHKSIERCLRSPRPRGLWDDQVLDRHVEAGSKYGFMWEATLDHVPVERAIHYAGRDSDGTHRLAPQLEERLRANALWDVYQADLGTVPLIDRMQQHGIRPDLPHFAQLSDELGGELHSILARLRGRIGEQAGAAGAPGGRDVAFVEGFNPNSGPQTSDLLFTRFGVDSLKKTPGGDPSTNDKVLEALEKDSRLPGDVRRIITDVREYREVYKLKHTFVDQIPDFVHRWPNDGRIHTTFKLTRVVTGRLAASDPNLLAMPKHGKFAKRFRQGFVSGDDTFLASWDLSQIELRVLAHLSQDPILLHAFRTGQDLHATLAQRIFGVAPKDQDKSKHRLPAKAVNFGIPMGMTNIGLCLELRKNGVDLDEDDAQRWLNETMALYAEVPRYQQGKIAEARRYGFVTDLRGRRRYIGGIRAFDQAIRAEAERFAFATPIQAGAQELMHEAEAHVYQHILLPYWDDHRRVEPIVQIHDDLLLECERDLVKELDTKMRFAMTQVPAHWLSVPIETSGECGVNWGDMHDIV
jgi:uracil-DNA glycosylase family 4